MRMGGTPFSQACTFARIFVHAMLMAVSFYRAAANGRDDAVVELLDVGADIEARCGACLSVHSESIHAHIRTRMQIHGCALVRTCTGPKQD